MNRIELALAGATAAFAFVLRHRCRWFLRQAQRILGYCGAALEFVTLGFYRFWLVTDIRRHLWSNTVVEGDAAEYTGRGRELLIGFLIALAILVPIYLGYFLISVEAEHCRRSPAFRWWPPSTCSASSRSIARAATG